MRNTKQKELILKTVNNSYNHLSAEAIYCECKKQMPSISLGTVYRNLNILVQEGLIKKIKVFDGIDRYDHLYKHAHFICIKCGNIIDVFDKFIEDISCIGLNKVIDYNISFNGIRKKCLEMGIDYGIKGK